MLLAHTAITLQPPLLNLVDRGKETEREGYKGEEKDSNIERKRGQVAPPTVISKSQHADVDASEANAANFTYLQNRPAGH